MNPDIEKAAMETVLDKKTYNKIDSSFKPFYNYGLNYLETQAKHTYPIAFEAGKKEAYKEVYFELYNYLAEHFPEVVVNTSYMNFWEIQQGKSPED